MKKTREREQEPKQESELDTTNEEGMILIGRMHGVGRECSLAGKGIEFRATGEQGGSRARGVEADAHRVPAVNVDYARALNLCACICERTLDLAFSKERIEKRPRRWPSV